MYNRMPIGGLLVACLWVLPTGAHGQHRPTVEITFQQAIALARQQAPTLQVAKARVKEAESKVTSASIWRFNPQLSGSAGPRFSTHGTTVDGSIQAQQWLELGGQRPKRVTAAEAGATAEAALSNDTERLLVREVGLVFSSALYWQWRSRLAKENIQIGETIVEIARRRHEVGDVGALEASVATLSLVRAQSDADRAEAAHNRARGHLKSLLGIDATTHLDCRGDLRQLGHVDTTAIDIEHRSDLRALRAEIRRAKATADLGRASRIPNLALGIGYSREESSDIVKGTLTVELPTFNRGQGVQATAKAREARLRLELKAATLKATNETGTARAVVRGLDSAVQRFEHGGLDALKRAEQLATASYKAGAIPLGELLALRRELVQSKLDYAELLFAAATARVEQMTSTGVPQ